MLEETFIDAPKVEDEVQTIHEKVLIVYMDVYHMLQGEFLDCETVIEDETEAKRNPSTNLKGPSC